MNSPIKGKRGKNCSTNCVLYLQQYEVVFDHKVWGKILTVVIPSPSWWQQSISCTLSIWNASSLCFISYSLIHTPQEADRHLLPGKDRFVPTIGRIWRQEEWTRQWWWWVFCSACQPNLWGKGRDGLSPRMQRRACQRVAPMIHIHCWWHLRLQLPHQLC